MNRYSTQIHQAIARSKRKSKSLVVFIDHKPYEEESEVDIKDRDSFRKGIEIFPVHIRQEENELVVTQYLNYRSAKIREEKIQRDAHLDSVDTGHSQQERVQRQTAQFNLQQQLKSNFQFKKLDWTLDELEEKALAKGSFLTTLIAFNLISSQDLTNPVFSQLNKVAKVENLPEVNGISFSTQLYMIAEECYRGGTSLLTSNQDLNRAMDLTVASGLTVRKVLAKGFEIHNFLINNELAKNYDLQGFKNFARQDNQELSRLEHFTDFIPIMVKFSTIPNLMIESLDMLEQQVVEMKGERDYPYVKIMQQSLQIPNMTSDGSSIKSYALKEDEEGYTVFASKTDVMDTLKLNMETYPLTLIMNTINMVMDNRSEFVRKTTTLMHDPVNKQYAMAGSEIFNDPITKSVSYNLTLPELIVLEAILEEQYKKNKKQLELIATQSIVIDAVKSLSGHITTLNSMDLLDM